MNVQIGAEAALFPEKEYISRIFIAVQALEKVPELVEKRCTKNPMTEPWPILQVIIYFLLLYIFVRLLWF